MAAYAELHCHSCYSLLDGASRPEELVARAAALGMDALALTDHDAVYGAVSFVEAARQAGIHPVLGAELTLEDGAHLTLLVENETGWHNLCTLISAGRGGAPKGESALPYDALAAHTAGLIALSGCRLGTLSRAAQAGDAQESVRQARRYRDWFGADRFYVELQHHLRPGDERLTGRLAALAAHVGLRCVATNNVHYATRDRHRLQDVLVCIRHNTTLDRALALRRPNSEFYLKAPDRMARLFGRFPEAVALSRELAFACQYTPAYGIQDLPSFPTPPGLSPLGTLRQLCAAAMPGRYEGCPPAVEQRLEYELGVIERARLSNYFLIVWDIVRYARAQGIRCQGRGSAANSLVAYLLGITPIDPLAHDLVFERFLSDERRLTPDIDIDFQADRREEVIQYLYQKYGLEHAAMACTFVTYRRRSAVRDVGKALGLPPGELEALAGQPDALEETPTTPLRQQLQTLCQQIQGLPRHLGIHNGGMVITGPRLAERAPTEPATMPGRTVVQWDKEALEIAGLVKMDILGLRMLSVIAETLHALEREGAAEPFEHLTFDDPAIFEMISAADTVGVFQVESRAQTQLQPIFKPRCFEDLIIAISLIRPGPIQGDMVHPYLRRRLGDEPVTYLHPALEPALRGTLGVILFQEQVLQVARDLAGFTPGQGELLRRALGKQNLDALEDLHDTFVAGALARGVRLEVAEDVYERLRAFGGYSFPKSHAAAFAVLVYQSAWLKRRHPAPFYAALLNNQPMGFWSPAVIVNDARRSGIEILPVHIHLSQAKCEAQGSSLRLGFNYVKGFGEASIARLLDARLDGPFADLMDFCRRARLPARLVEHLILTGAFDTWAVPRRKLLWEAGKLSYPVDELGLIFPDDGVSLPELSERERFALEFPLLGVSPQGHLMEFYREWRAAHGVLTTADARACANGKAIQVAGLVVVHQAPPSAKGFHFVTLEDEFGLLDVILRPDVYAHYKRMLHGAGVLVAEGVMQRRDGTYNLLARRVQTL